MSCSSRLRSRPCRPNRPMNLRLEPRRILSLTHRADAQDLLPHRPMGGDFSSAFARASSAASFGGAELPDVPAALPFLVLMVATGRPQGHADVWPRHARHHSAHDG